MKIFWFNILQWFHGHVATSLVFIAVLRSSRPADNESRGVMICCFFVVGCLFFFGCLFVEVFWIESNNHHLRVLTSVYIPFLTELSI